MAIQFPSNPDNEDSYLDPQSGTEWIYNSSDNSWTIASSGTASPFNWIGQVDVALDYASQADGAYTPQSGDQGVQKGSTSPSTAHANWTGIDGDSIADGVIIVYDGSAWSALNSSVPGYPDVDNDDYQSGTLDDRYLSLAAGTGAQVVQSTDPTEFKSAVKVGSIAFPSDTAPYEVESRGIVYNSSKKALLSTNKPNAAGESVSVFESRIDGTQYNGDGTRSPLNIARGTSYKAASPMGNVAGEYGSYDSYVGFHATNPGTRGSDAIWTGAADSYGVLSSVETRAEATGNTFNFYSEGTAPNYFRGNVFVNTSDGYISSNPGFRVRSSSTNLDDSGLEVLSYSSNTNNTRNALLFTKRDADGVEPTSVAGRLVINGGVGAASSITLVSGDGNQPFIVTLSDYRTTSLSSFASLASTVVKQLNPGSNGFIAHEVAEVIPSAVIGTKDATEAIGTLADYDGTVLQTAVVEPGDLTYTEDVEVGGVSTATVRTRTWTATGTQPCLPRCGPDQAHPTTNQSTAGSTGSY